MKKVRAHSFAAMKSRERARPCGDSLRGGSGNMGDVSESGKLSFKSDGPGEKRLRRRSGVQT